MKRPAPAPDGTALARLFLQHKLTLALAESCTRGLAATKGVGDVLLASVVTYHALAKQKLLGVRRAQPLLGREQTTNEMALGLHQHLPQADVCVAVTGLCGPGASVTPEKPVGTVFVTSLLDGQAHEYRAQLAATDSNALRQQAVNFIYPLLAELLGRRQVTAPPG